MRRPRKSKLVVDFNEIIPEQEKLGKLQWSADTDAAWVAFAEWLRVLEEMHGPDLTALEFDALRTVRQSAIAIHRAQGDKSRRLIDLVDRNWNN